MENCKILRDQLSFTNSHAFQNSQRDQFYPKFIHVIISVKSDMYNIVILHL